VARSNACRGARDGACVRRAEEVRAERAGAGDVEGRSERRGAQDPVSACTPTSGGSAGTCKNCGAAIGGVNYCSECNGANHAPVNGECADVSTSTEFCTKDGSTGTCSACKGASFMFKGGCYEKGKAPGSTICQTGGNADGLCEACADGYFRNPEAANNVDSCISCGDTAGVIISSGGNTHTYTGVDGCVRCAAPQAISTPTGAQVAAATCTTCGDGKYGAACDQNCDASCKSCTGAGTTACTSCKPTKTANGKEYFRIKDDAAKTGECVTETDCKTGNTYFPTTTTGSKRSAPPAATQQTGA
ncbi:Variant-specific surface protein, partial [Giardia duodenalis]